MSFTVQNVISRARRIAADQDGTLWLEPELVDWINDALRTIVIVKPDSNSITASFLCSGGTKQTLPPEALLLLDVVRNLAGTMRVVRYVPRDQLDTENPTWHSMTPSATAIHYTYDERQRDVFYVYPPAIAEATELEIVYSGIPVALTATDAVPFADVYMPIIVDYVLYRMYSKEANYAANQDRAMSFYQSFTGALGGKAAGEKAETASANAPSVTRM